MFGWVLGLDPVSFCADGAPESRVSCRRLSQEHPVHRMNILKGSFRTHSGWFLQSRLVFLVTCGSLAAALATVCVDALDSSPLDAWLLERDLPTNLAETLRGQGYHAPDSLYLLLCSTSSVFD